jgi:hypothetical protein
MLNFTNVAVPLLATVAIPGVLPTAFMPPPPVEAPPSIEKKGQPFAIVKEFETEQTAIRQVAPEPKEKRLICKGCNDYENAALAFLQNKGIKDRNALATIMGNIRQESTFVPNVCEGGARTGYHGCRSGGFGLIQWTTENRYYGLGQFARRFGGNPSSLNTQLHYMVNEAQWKLIEPKLKTPGKSIDRYMNYAYSWLGWGHHGARTSYAYDYARRFTLGS